jgi:hypothetical protein
VRSGRRRRSRKIDLKATIFYQDGRSYAEVRGGEDAFEVRNRLRYCARACLGRRQGRG